MRDQALRNLRAADAAERLGCFERALAWRIDAFRIMMQARRYGLALRILNGADARNVAPIVNR